MLRIFWFALLFAGTMIKLSGQSEGIEELNELLSNQDILINNPVVRNLSVISQVEDENHVILFQQQKGTAFNSVTISQDGFKNTGRIHQTGTGLETRLWQSNSDNAATLVTTGDNIKVEAKQEGSGNFISNYIENAGNLVKTAAMHQEGNDNTIELTLMWDGFSDHSPEQRVEISQKGNAHELKANLESYGMPFQIEQLAGPGGEGMKVDVSTSAFSFPMK